MKWTLALALVAVLTAGVSAKTVDTTDQISDPDMLKAMRDAKESNLTNAMARSHDETASSVKHLAALMLASEAGLRAAVKDLKGMVGRTLEPGSLEEATDDLHLSTQMLAQKASVFRKRARALSFKVPKADPEKLIPLRAAYPSQDRARDIEKAGQMLKKARKKTGDVSLNKAQRKLADAAFSFHGEVKNATTLLRSIRKKITKRRRKRPEYSVAEKRLEVYSARTKKDETDLSIEARMLEISLLMTRHDDEAFDQGF
jgi:hypothetical protein